MPTINQLIRRPRKQVRKKIRTADLEGNPQARGVLTRVYHDSAEAEFRA